MRVHGLVALAAREVGHALEVLGQPDHGGVRPGVRDELGQPVVEAQAVDEHEVGLGDAADVRRRGIERVDLAALGHEAVHAHAVAAHLAHEVGEDRGGGDDPERVAATRRRSRARPRRPPAGASATRAADAGAAGATEADGRRSRHDGAVARVRRLAGGAQAEDLEAVGGDAEPRPVADLAEHVGEAEVGDVQRSPAAVQMAWWWWTGSQAT